MALKKLPWWGNYSLQLVIPVAVATFFLLYLFSWVLSATFRRIYQVNDKGPSPLVRVSKWAAGITMGCFLIFLVGFALSAGSEAIIYGLTPLALASLIFGMAGTATLVIFIGLVTVCWIKGRLSFVRKMGWSTIITFSLAFVWWMNYWNLLGLRV